MNIEESYHLMLCRRASFVIALGFLFLSGCGPSPGETILTVEVSDRESLEPISDATVTFAQTSDLSDISAEAIIDNRGRTFGATSLTGCVEGPMKIGYEPIDLVCQRLFLHKYWIVRVAHGANTETVVIETPVEVECFTQIHEASGAIFHVRATISGSPGTICDRLAP